MLRYVTSGESHGKCLIGILEGLPAGLPVDAGFINLQLRRRQLGYGRGGRMKIEKDEAEVMSGIRHGRTLGSPITLMIRNRDWSHWEIPMSPEPVPQDANVRPLTRPRPGHVDLPGALKYQTYDARDLLERASARETAARVAVGALCELFLRRFDVVVAAHVLAIGDVWVGERYRTLGIDDIVKLDAESELRCADPEVHERMKQAIDQARGAGDTIGGVLEVVAAPVPAGLGSHTQWDRKLDGILAQALMSIPAAKAVELGTGISAAAAFGSQVHDEIFYDNDSRSFYRKTNRAGGLEAGITNGSELRARVYMKPIPTLRKPLMSADLRTKEPFEAAFERSDTCVVPAAAVIAEAMTAYVVAGAFVEKFGGDSIGETEANFRNYCRMVREY
jgi:chorismate synthase